MLLGKFLTCCPNYRNENLFTFVSSVADTLSVRLKKARDTQAKAKEIIHEVESKCKGVVYISSSTKHQREYAKPSPCLYACAVLFIPCWFQAPFW